MHSEEVTHGPDPEEVGDGAVQIVTVLLQVREAPTGHRRSRLMSVDQCLDVYTAFLSPSEPAGELGYHMKENKVQ